MSSYWTRRRLLTSLSRSALVLPLAEVLMLATPPWARGSTAGRRQTATGGGAAGEPAYEAKPVAASAGRGFADRRHSAGSELYRCRNAIGLERQDDLWRRGHNKYLLETTGCGVAFYDYDQDGWLDIFLVNGWRLEGFAPGPGTDLPSVQEQPRRNIYRRYRQGRDSRAADGARAAASATTTTMAMTICSSATTARMLSFTTMATELHRCDGKGRA